MHYSSVFSKRLINRAFIFSSFGLITQNVGNFKKILNVFDETSIDKLNFYFIFIFNFIFHLFFENFLVKIDTSEITPLYYYNFSVLGDFPLSAWLRPCLRS